MLRGRLVAMWCALGLALAGGCSAQDDRPARWSYIYPAIIAPNCATSGCHSSLTATFGLQMDTSEGAYLDLVGGIPKNPDPAGFQNYVVPGQPDRSKLMWQLRGIQTLRMPPDGPLPDPDIALIERWILEGARKD